MIYQIGQEVYIKYHKDQQFYPAKIVDIEQCKKCVGRPTHYEKDSTEYELTGRYGVQFTDINPTIIDIPYFWEREIYTHPEG